LYALPGNPGIAELATCLSGSGALAAAESIGADLTVVGPEAPLAAGVVDRFRERGRPIVGPSAAAARLESSKIFAKEFMQRHEIPTARSITAENAEQARDALRSFGYPVVVKADGLAAGKGVMVAHDDSQAQDGIEQLFAISSRLVIEEFLTGDEVSFIVLTDGAGMVALEPTQDHKTLNDGDTGPNTGGMGAYSDSRILNHAERSRILAEVIEPAIAGMRAEGHPFTGFLYAGLMMTPDGPRVLEFNARLGDPETQALMRRLDSDLFPVLWAAANGELGAAKLHWSREPSVCVVLAAAGYPASSRTGDPITGLDQIERATVFQAATKKIDNVLYTSGGRVLGVTSSGPDLAFAMSAAYTEVRKIHFEGMHYRTDIGRKGLQR
jgi:phosphoribosylamine--glycine ligase